MQHFCGIHSLRQRNFGLKIKAAQTIQAHSCEQLSLLMQFLYGVTTLRDTCKYEPRRREAMKFAPAKKIRDFGWPNPSPASIFWKISSFRNFGVMHHRWLATYNFLDLQRPAVILSEYQLRTMCDNMARKLLRNPFVSITKTWSENQNSPNYTSSFVWAIAPADAISLRCKHSTRHLNMNHGAARQ